MIGLRRLGVPRLLVAALAALAPAAPAVAQTVAPVRHELVIRDFRTEGGVVLPQARVVYGTYGTLDAAGDAAVLLPSHYMADLTGYGFLIGPGKALDPTKLFLITTEMFGNGRSSSPSNTPEPLRGPRFPAITVRDDVAAILHLIPSDGAQSWADRGTTAAVSRRLRPDRQSGAGASCITSHPS